jgi:hypothetical protein
MRGRASINTGKPENRCPSFLLLLGGVLQQLRYLCESSQYLHTLRELGYPQPSTSLLRDNTCAVGLANDYLKPKRSKAILMRYHWVREQRVQSEDFGVT